MAFEGAQMVPVYDMNKSDGDGFMGGGAGWMWVVMLFFLLAWGGGFGGFGGNGANGAVNTLTNEFLYTNLNNTLDRGFNQLANQNFGIQKDICESTGALQMGLCQGFNQTNAAIAESRFAAQQCCCETQKGIANVGCETNRNIDSVRAENYKNTCEIVNAINADGEKTRAVMVVNTVQELRHKLADRDRELQTANFQLSQQAQSAALIGTLRPFPQPAFITCSPYQSAANNVCGCV